MQNSRGRESEAPSPPPLPPRGAPADPELAPRQTGLSLVLMWGMAIAAILGLLLIHRYDPAQHAFYPRCQFHEVTGWHCPGCGTLRGLHSAAQGDLLGAVRRNALVFGVAPLALVAGGWYGRRSATGTRRWVGAAWMVWAALIVTLLFGILRNLPFPPFSLLAP